MSGRPWLEALKITIRERGADTEKPSEKILETLASEGCERCESLADELDLVLEDQAAEKECGTWGEEERGLMDAGWEPKERGGLVIWANPETGFYCSQEVALYCLEALEAANFRTPTTQKSARDGHWKRGANGMKGNQ
jgi:hypothetical protein